MSQHQCESCGMPIETGPYCQYCVDENGQLQDFQARFDRMVGWAMQEGTKDRATAEKETIAYMATMPAWANHPEIKARLDG